MQLEQTSNSRPTELAVLTHGAAVRPYVANEQNTGSVLDGRRPRSTANVVHHVTLNVDNSWPIAAAYGVSARNQIAAAIEVIIDEHLANSGIRPTFRSPLSFGVEYGELGALPLAALLEELFVAIGSAAFRVGGERVHALVSRASPGKAPWKRFLEGPRSVPFATQGWIKRYRADMELGANLLEAIASNRVELVRQPVRDGDDLEAHLYSECLLRIIGPKGEREAAGAGIQALERLGLVRLLDRCMVSRVIKTMESDRDVRLAVNISGRSTVIDPWWESALARLSVAPSVAQRLVIEVTETAPLNSKDATNFAARLHDLGCAVALDDFGAGYSTRESLDLLTPDFVKIDRQFLHQARDDEAAYSRLCTMISLARSARATVIVEGVETLGDWARSRAAGGRWQQGFLYGLV